MTGTRPHLEPGPDHPITVEPAGRRVTVRAGAEVIADTGRAVELREASYPPVLYIPLEDVDGNRLRPSDLHTYCPYKGEASYFDIVAEAGPGMEGAVWYYPDPYPAVSRIKGMVAFYPDRVSIESIPGDGAGSAAGSPHPGS